jgi:hypothetical protein
MAGADGYDSERKLERTALSAAGLCVQWDQTKRILMLVSRIAAEHDLRLAGLPEPKWMLHVGGVPA